MSKPTVSAAGGAMPAEGQPPREREAHAEGFLRLKALRLSIEKALDDMSKILDAVEAPPAATPEQRSRAGAATRIGDGLDVSKALVDAAYMAAGDLQDFQREAMRTLLDETSSKLGTAQKEFAEVYCGGYVNV
jgi:hypothetical protein